MGFGYCYQQNPTIVLISSFLQGSQEKIDKVVKPRFIMNEDYLPALLMAVVLPNPDKRDKCLGNSFVTVVLLNSISCFLLQLFRSKALKMVI